jgi:hypothetical protein
LADKHENINIEVWDTPGLFDKQGKDQMHVAEIVQKMKGIEVDLFCLVLNARDMRFGEVEITMLATFNQIFFNGERNWMENFCVVYTHWETGARADAEREVNKVPPMSDIEQKVARAVQNTTSFNGFLPVFFVDNFVWHQHRTGAKKGSFKKTPEQQAAVRSNFSRMRLFAEGRQPFSCADIKEALPGLEQVTVEEKKLLELANSQKAEDARRKQDLGDLKLGHEKDLEMFGRAASNSEQNNANLRAQFGQKMQSTCHSSSAAQIAALLPRQNHVDGWTPQERMLRFSNALRQNRRPNSRRCCKDGACKNASSFAKLPHEEQGGPGPRLSSRASTHKDSHFLRQQELTLPDRDYANHGFARPDYNTNRPGSLGSGHTTNSSDTMAQSGYAINNSRHPTPQVSNTMRSNIMLCFPMLGWGSLQQGLGTQRRIFGGG